LHIKSLQKAYTYWHRNFLPALLLDAQADPGEGPAGDAEKSQLVAHLPIPAENVTACVFGGMEWNNSTSSRRAKGWRRLI